MRMNARYQAFLPSLLSSIQAVRNQFSRDHRCAELEVRLAHHVILPDASRSPSRSVYSLRTVTCNRKLTAAPASIERILNLNHVPHEPDDLHHVPAAANGLIPQSTPILNSDGEPIWKVLVFDNLGRDVISSVLRVNDLRGWGITIHL